MERLRRRNRRRSRGGDTRTLRAVKEGAERWADEEKEKERRTRERRQPLWASAAAARRDPGFASQCAALFLQMMSVASAKYRRSPRSCFRP